MEKNTVTTAIAPISNHAVEVAGRGMTREQLELLKRTIAKGTTDDEFALFVATANRMGLDPFAKQIFCVKRWDTKEQREVMSIQVSIDGLRVGAHRTGEVDGQEGPFWCGPDMVWREVWLENTPPAAAKVVVYRKGCARGFIGIARFRSYVQTKKDGAPNQMWSRGDDFMLAKCAEALALRKAFPSELGGVPTPEEAGADDIDQPKAFTPITTPPASLPPPITKPADPIAAPAPKPEPNEAEVEELIAAMQQTKTVEELRKLAAARIGGIPDGPVKEKLGQAYTAHKALIVTAANAERQS